MKGFAVFGLVAALISLIFVAAIVAPVVGAFVGLLVGWIFSDTSAYFLQKFGIEVEMWQVGAMLGFVGSFFKTVTTNKKD